MHENSESPLVIPCKFSAVIYSELLSGTHSVATRVLPISVENKDLHSASVSGSECQRAGTPSVNPLFRMTVSPSLESLEVVARSAVNCLSCRPSLFLIGQIHLIRIRPVMT